MLKYKIFLGFVGIMIISTILLFAVPASATNTNITDNIQIRDTLNNGSYNSSTNIYTATASVSGLKNQTNEITFYNDSETQTYKFTCDYSVSGGSDPTGFPNNSKSGKLELTLTPGTYATTYSITSKRIASTRTSTLTISNITIEEVVENSNITIQYDSSYGSVAVGGASLNEGSSDTYGVAPGNSISLSATPGNGSSFICWYNGSTMEVLSESASFSYTPAEDITVVAAFANARANAWFMTLGDSHLFVDLNEAGTHASSLSNKTVVLLADGTLPAGDYTIPSGVTLLIPRSSKHEDYAGSPTHDSAESVLSGVAYATPSAYRTLTLASGAVINVEGIISLPCNQFSASGTETGMPSGAYGCIKMSSGSQIIVKNGGIVYAWGYISRVAKGNEGSVTVKSGGVVYEYFQITDWRGGSVVSDILENEQKVFPFTQYYVQNIEVPLTLENGANDIVRAAITATKVRYDKEVNFIGSSGMFHIGENSSVTKNYDEDNDRLILTLDGNLTISNIAIKIASYDIDSADYVLPLNNNITIKMNSGNTNIPYDVAVLPGCKIEISNGATVTLGSSSKTVNLYFYDKATWESKGYLNGGGNIRQVKYVNGTRAARSLTDSQAVIGGTIDATYANLYVTNESGASTVAPIKGLEGGRLIANNAPVTDSSGNAIVTYQYIQGTNTFDALTIESAWLLNGNALEATTDDDYTYTAKSGTSPNTYTYTNGRWICTTHTYGEWTQTKAPTCTDAGEKCRTCTVCDHVETVAIPTIDHSYTSVVTAPTCTAQGYTTYTCSVCGHSYKDNYTATAAHTPGAAREENSVEATCTAEGHYDSVVYCTVCSAELSRETKTIVKAPHSFDTQTFLCTKCQYAAIRLDAMNLDLQGEILLNFKFTVDPAVRIDDVIVQIHEEKNAITGEITRTVNLKDLLKTDDKNRYIVSQGIAAGEMTGEVTVKFLLNGKEITFFDKCADNGNGKNVTTITKTVKDVLKMGITSSTSSEALKDLYKAAATFGGYAQAFYKTHLDDLANQELTEDGADLTLTTDEIDKIVANLKEFGTTTADSTVNGIGIEANTHQVNLDSKVFMRVYFKLTGTNTIDDYSFKIVYPEGGINSGEMDVTPIEENGRYYIDIKNIPVAYWNNNYIITVTRNEDKATYTVTSSVLAWVNSCIYLSQDDPQRLMALAMYNFAMAADAYYEEGGAE